MFLQCENRMEGVVQVADKLGVQSFSEDCEQEFRSESVAGCFFNCVDGADSETYRTTFDCHKPANNVQR